MSPATAKDGKISAIVHFATHIDHTEHDVSGIVTEHGFADLRGRSPKEKAKEVIEILKSKDVAVKTQGSGLVQGVSFDGGAAELVVNGVRVKMTDVVQVSQGSQPSQG